MRSPLFSRLREATAESHAALEAAFNLDRVLTGPEAASRVLERFYGFHVVWEAAMAGTGSAAFAAGRSRLPLLIADLASLGVGQEALAALPRCEAAAAIPTVRAGEIGSLYVLEGSTLGGQLISRALKEQAWVPPAGLTYFTPYAAQTGEQWRAFMAWADKAAEGEEVDAIVARANETFDILRAWLPA